MSCVKTVVIHLRCNVVGLVTNGFIIHILDHQRNYFRTFFTHHPNGYDKDVSKSSKC